MNRLRIDVLASRIAQKGGFVAAEERTAWMTRRVALLLIGCFSCSRQHRKPSVHFLYAHIVATMSKPDRRATTGNGRADTRIRNVLGGNLIKPAQGLPEYLLRKINTLYGLAERDNLTFCCGPVQASGFRRDQIFVQPE